MIFLCHPDMWDTGHVPRLPEDSSILTVPSKDFVNLPGICGRSLDFLMKSSSLTDVTAYGDALRLGKNRTFKHFRTFNFNT